MSPSAAHRPGPLPPLDCRACGRPITRHGRTGRWIHRAGGAVAACDLDGDHIPRPDWTPFGVIRCRTCDAIVTPDADDELRHADPSIDRDHTPDPDVRRSG